MINNKHRCIGVITWHSWVGVSPSVLNTLVVLSQKGINVDFYAGKVNERFPIPNFDSEYVNVIKWQSPREFPLNNYYFYKHVFQRHKKYDVLIGFDVFGLILAGFVGTLSKTPFVYHSLEILFIDKSSWLKALKCRMLKSIERYFSIRSIYALTQDNQRADYIALDNKIPRENMKIVYNSPIGKITHEKHQFFHEKFGISLDKKICLVSGNLMWQHGSEEIVDSVKFWNKKYVLVLHGWFPQEKFKQNLFKKIRKFSDQIYYSDEFIPNEQKHIIFTSVDIGFVFYKDTNINGKLAAGASGKLFDFFKAGVPIIGNDAVGMRELVEANHSGIVFKNLEEIADKLELINRDYMYYRNNAFRAFEKYEFSKNYENVLSEIVKKINISMFPQ